MEPAQSVTPHPVGVSALGSNDISPDDLDGFEETRPLHFGDVKRKGRLGGPSPRCRFALISLGVVITVGFVVLVVVGSSGESQVSALHKEDDDLEHAVPNDLWAIHDLLLAGYTGAFMEKGSPGQIEVEEAALELARLLPALHPHKACRKQLAHMLQTTPGQPARPSALERTKSHRHLTNVAEATWKCLPAHFFSKSFDRPFLSYEMSGRDAAYLSRMTRVRNKHALGVCKGTSWHRTCSYWASMHALAYRADELGFGHVLLKALTTIIAGGATLCGGCTLHFRLMMWPSLSEAVRRDFGKVF